MGGPTLQVVRALHGFHAQLEQIIAHLERRTAMPRRKTLECPPPPVPGKGAASYSVGKPGRPNHFDEAKFRDVLNEFGGSLTRENKKDVTAKMGAGISTVWRWWKSLSNK